MQAKRMNRVVGLLALASAAGAWSSTAAAAGLVIDGEQIVDQATYDKAKAEGKLNFYSGYAQAPEQVLVDQFQKDTGIQVELTRIVPHTLVERAISEHAAGKLPADLIRGSDFGYWSRMKNAGVLAAVDAPQVKNIADVKYADGMFYRWADQIYTIAYNSGVVKAADAPTSWADLTSGKWTGSQIGIVQGGSGGSTAALTHFQLSQLGQGWLTKFAALKPRIFDSVGASSASLARGEIAVSTQILSGVNVAAGKGAPIKFIVPKEGMATFDSFIGVTSTASHPAAAKTFLLWTLSKRGQAAVAKVGEYPVRSDVAPPEVMGVKLPALNSKQVFRFSVADSEKFTAPELKIWNTTFGYNK